MRKAAEAFLPVESTLHPSIIIYEAGRALLNSRTRSDKARLSCEVGKVLAEDHPGRLLKN